MPWSRLSRCAKAAGLLMVLGGTASAQELAAPVEEPLYLEVFINDQPTGLIANFVRSGGDRLAITITELQELRLRPDCPRAGDLVELDECPNLDYRYDIARQSVRIEIGDRERIPFGLDTAQREVVKPEPTAPGAVLNYSLFATTGANSDSFLFYPVDASFSAGIDARIFNRLGVLSQTAILTTGIREESESVRLDTTWSWEDQEDLISYAVGDIISGGLNWTRPLRLGGAQVRRNFGLRPDLITLPLPEFSGSAAVPSTVDVFVNSVRSYSGDVPAGPFELRNLPVMSGAGTQRVVVHDALGRETVVDRPYYSSSKMLDAGLYDFSVESGFIRRDFGLESNDYDSEAVGSGSVRYGLNERWTLEAHGEAGGGLWNTGAGVNVLLSHWGVASVAAAASRGDGGTGGLISASFEAGWNGYTLYARTQRTTTEYLDLASLPTTTSGAGGLPRISLRPPRVLDQVAVGIPLEGSALALSVTRMQDDLDNNYDILGATYSRRIGANTSLYVSGFKDYADGGGVGVFGGITVSLGGGITANASASWRDDGSNIGLDVTKSASGERGSVGWRARDYEGDGAARGAGVTYHTGFGRAEASAQQVAETVEAHAQFEGSVAVAGGGVFLANRIDDAFAVVDAGAPDVAVYYANREVATTGRSGKVLVPSLRAYEQNWISIDAKNLPVDAEVPVTRTVATPSRRGATVVKFGVSRQSTSAIVAVTMEDGTPVPAGSLARLESAGEDFVVGYDGEVFLRGLSAQNALLVERDGEAPCRAEFAYLPRPGDQVVIRDVVCR